MDNNFGAKVSLPGFQVETAADQNLYFSSSWPVLKIDLALSNKITNFQTSDAVITHKLGYPPFTLVWSQQNGFLGPASSVNFQTLTLSTTIGDTLQYYTFRNPLNINFHAPNIQLANTLQGTGNEDFGIKFTKPGKNTDSKDLRDYTIHSGTKSLQVHQVIYQPLAQYNDINLGLPNNPNNKGLKYLTDLPYAPVFFAFYSSDNQTFVPVYAASQVPPKVNFNTIDGGIIINNGTTGGWGVFYILKDPYQSTTQIGVTL